MMLSSSPFSNDEFGYSLLSTLKPLLPFRRVLQLHKGSKNLWRQRILVDIIILQHEKLKITDSKQSEYYPICIEIIVINPSVESDISPLYMSYSKLYNKLMKYDTPIQSVRIPTVEESECVQKLIINYVINRVDLSSNVLVLGHGESAVTSFKAILLLLQGDDAGDEMMMIERPSFLFEDAPLGRRLSLSVSENKLEFESKIVLLRQESRRASIDCQRAGEMSVMTTNAIKSLDEIIELQSGNHWQGDNVNDESDDDNDVDDDDDDDDDDDIDDENDVHDYDDSPLAKGESEERKGSNDNDNEGMKRIAINERTIPTVKENLSASTDSNIKRNSTNIAGVGEVSNSLRNGNTSGLLELSDATAQNNNGNVTAKVALPPLHLTSSFVHTPRRPLALLDLALQKGYLGKFRSTSLSVLTNKEDIPIGKLSKKNRSSSLQSQFTSIATDRMEKEIIKSKDVKKERKKSEQIEIEDEGGKGNGKYKSNERIFLESNVKNLDKLKDLGSSGYHRGRKASTSTSTLISDVMA